MPLGTSGPKIPIDTSQSSIWEDSSYDAPSGVLKDTNANEYYLLVGQDANGALVSKLVSTTGWAQEGRPIIRISEDQHADIVEALANQESPEVELTDSDTIAVDGC